MVEADSIVLMNTREKISDSAVRSKSLRDSNKDFRDILKSMSDIKANSSLIKDFFVTLRSLAVSDADQKIGQSLDGLVGQIDSLAKTLSKDDGFIKEDSGDAITRILNTGSTFVVKKLQHAAIQDVLERYGSTVKNALAVQEAYVARLREWVEADGGTLLKLKEKEVVVDPYVNADPLPSDWPTQRLSALRASTDLTGIAEAEIAARRVKQAFDALADNKLDIGHIQAIVEQLGRIVTVAEDLKSLTEKEAN